MDLALPRLESWRTGATSRNGIHERLPWLVVSLPMPPIFRISGKKSRLHWSSRQGCESSGVLSPHTTNCLGRWLAYPMHAEATKHVQLGRKSLGCPAAISCSGRDDLGGEQT